MRLHDYQDSPEDGVSQWFLEGSSPPKGEPGRAGLTHGSDAPSIQTTNQSEAGGSVRNSSVAPPPSAGSSEALEQYPPEVLRSQPRHRCHVSFHRTRSDRSGRTGNGTVPPLTCSPSSSISDLSVLDGIGDRAYAKSMRRAQEDGTVRTSLSQQTNFLECLWGRMTGYEKVFHVWNSAEWATHMKEHFVLKKEGRRGPTCKYISPPTSNSCVFCHAKFQADSGDSSWSKLVNHVEVHYMRGHRLTRIDWPLVEYLWEKGLLTSAEYRELKPIKNTQGLPWPPGLSDDEDPIVKVEGGRHRRG